MATLREYTAEYQMILDLLLDPEADQESLQYALADLGEEIEKKADAIAGMISEGNGSSATLKAEIDRLTTKKRAIDNKVDSLKRYLEMCMIATEKTKFKTDLYSFNIQKNAPSVVIAPDVDVNAIPEEYVKKEINKTAVKDALKEGKELKWAILQQTESIRIR